MKTILLAWELGGGLGNLMRLRPLAAESLHAMFGLAMDAATERTLERVQERAA